jgi:hypothetical protein
MLGREPQIVAWRAISLDNHRTVCIFLSGELEAESQPGAHSRCDGHLSRTRRECPGLLSAVGDHAHWPTCRPQSWQL